jgi:hypothetical protein
MLPYYARTSTELPLPQIFANHNDTTPRLVLAEPSAQYRLHPQYIIKLRGRHRTIHVFRSGWATEEAR